MNIKILKLLSGAKKASGLTVIIDVFRAFSTACYIINQEGELFVTDSINTAKNLKSRKSSLYLVGERNGEKIAGFDFGNSPFEVRNINFSNNPVVLTTSAGTKGLINAQNAEKIITGSFLNAGAIVNYIENSDYNTVSLVAMGDNGTKINKEDLMCAEYLRDMLLNKNRNLDQNKLEKSLKKAGNRFFDSDTQGSYPQDFYMSLDINKFDFVLEANRIEDNLYKLNKIK